MTIIGHGLIARSLATSAFDAVIFAAGVSDSRAVDEAEYARETQLLHQTLLECQRTGQRLVYFSSAGQIYGDCPGIRSEETRPAPTTRYGYHKLECEDLIRNADCPHLIVRLPNLVGATQNAGQLVPGMVSQVVSGFATVRMNATRDLLGVDRLGPILAELLPRAERHELVVVASGISISAWEICEEIARILDLRATMNCVAGGDRQQFGITRFRQLAPASSQFDSSYPYDVLQKYVKHLANAGSSTPATTSRV